MNFTFDKIGICKFAGGRLFTFSMSEVNIELLFVSLSLFNGFLIQNTR